MIAKRAAVGWRVAGSPSIFASACRGRQVRARRARRCLCDESLDQRGRIDLGIYLHVQRSTR